MALQLMSKEQIVWQAHPHWLGQVGWYIRKSPWMLAPSVIAGALGWLGLLNWLWASAVIVVAVGIWFGIGYLIRRTTRYTITTHRARKAWGVFSRQSDEARLVRIQNIAVDQSFIQRLFGLGHVDLDTAGEIAEDMLCLRHVRRPEAVRSLIAQTISESDQGTHSPL